MAQKTIFVCDECGVDIVASNPRHPFVVTVMVGTPVQGVKRKALSMVPFPKALRKVALHGPGRMHLCLACATPLVGPDQGVENPDPRSVDQEIGHRLMRSPDFNAIRLHKFDVTTSPDMTVTVRYQRRDKAEIKADVWYAVSAVLIIDQPTLDADYDELENELVTAILTQEGLI